MAAQGEGPVLSWAGKELGARPVPHRLVEDPALSYGAPSNNLLVHGDNLLALAALRPALAGQVKCVYIDPPYNTGVVLDDYDDGAEHGAWLGDLRDRLLALRALLRDDGVVAVQIGFDEMAYLKVLMDEIFGRGRCIGQVAVRMSHSAGMKRLARERRLVKNTEYLLFYYKATQPALSPLYEECLEYPVNYYHYVVRDPAPGRPGRFVPLAEALAVHFPAATGRRTSSRLAHELFRADPAFRAWVVTNRARIARKDANVPATVRVPGGLAPDEFAEVRGSDRSYFVGRGRGGATWQLYTLADKVQPVSSDDDGTGLRLAVANLLGDWWDGFWRDMSRVDREGGVLMKGSKKPERLVERVLRLVTEPGDLVLDAYLGSGTTAAVAHKTGRRWVGIEAGEHCLGKARPRLVRVVDGQDPTGVTAAAGWRGGGGFRFCRLVPGGDP